MKELENRLHPGIILARLFDKHNLLQENLLKCGSFNVTVIRRVFLGMMPISADIAYTIESNFPQLGVTAEDLLYKQADYALYQVKAESTANKLKRLSHDRADSKTTK